MARLPLALSDRPQRPPQAVRIALAYARKQFGRDTDSALAMSHHPGVLFPWALMETAGMRRRTALPAHLADLVQFVAAVTIGCSWCVDFGASIWEEQGLDPQTLTAAVHWRDSDRFDPDTRAALGFAEAASGDLDAVTDQMVADLRQRFGEKGLVELSFLVALENMRSRFNASLGLSSQGFSSGDACAVALAKRGTRQPESSAADGTRVTLSGASMP